MPDVPQTDHARRITALEDQVAALNQRVGDLRAALAHVQEAAQLLGGLQENLIGAHTRTGAVLKALHDALAARMPSG